jgi:membrane associated rhomboid family serine protease
VSSVSEGSAVPWTTLALGGGILAGFGLELRLGDDLASFVQRWGVVPRDLLSSPPALITLLTAIFLHAGWLHVLSNLLYLAVFGSAVEARLGHLRYLVLFLASGLVGDLVYSLLQSSSTTPAIGASGAIAGSIGAFLVLSAGAPVLFFPFVDNVPVLPLLGLWLLAQVLSGLASIITTGAGAWWAHLGGFVCGLLLAPLLRLSRHRARGLRT